MPELDWGITSRWNSFAMLYTKPWIRDYGRPDKLNLEMHNCFELRFRGDGRKYDFDVMATRNSIDSKVSFACFFILYLPGVVPIGTTNEFLLHFF